MNKNYYASGTGYICSLKGPTPMAKGIELEDAQIIANLLNERDELAFHPFNRAELLEIFEAAKLCLINTITFHKLAEHLATSEEYLEDLQKKLEKFLDKK